MEAEFIIFGKKIRVFGLSCNYALKTVALDVSKTTDSDHFLYKNALGL